MPFAEKISNSYILSLTLCKFNYLLAKIYKGMGVFHDFESIPEKVDREELRIDYGKQRIHITLSAFKFVDKDTLQHIIYLPSLDISAYGETEEKATEMLKFSLEESLQMIIETPPKKLPLELSKLGWKKNFFRNKEYSKAYVDIDGELQGFNAIDNKIERVTLVA